MTFTIPIVPPPVDDETLTSWVSRIAAANLMPPTWVMKAAGWTRSNHHTDTPKGYGVYLTPDHAIGLSRATGITPERIQQMVPTTWVNTLARGTDKQGRDITQDARRFAFNNWLYISGSHYCPQCLHDNGGAWLLTWKSPFTFACPTHRIALHTHCPTCQHRADYGRLDASRRPAYPKAIPKPGHCHNPARQTGTKQQRTPCGHDHTKEEPQLVLPDHFVTAQEDIHSASRPNSEWNDLAALTTYTLAVHTADDVEHLLQQPLPPEMRHRWIQNQQAREERLATNRERVRTEGLDYRAVSQDTTGRTPPTDTHLLTTAVTLAHQALRSGTHLQAFIQQGRDLVHLTPKSRLTNLNASPQLIDRAVNAHLGDHKALRDVGLHSRYRNKAAQPVPWNAQHLPPYLWPDLYEAHLAHLFNGTAVAERTARKFAIIALYRSVTGTTWNEATQRFLDGALKNPRLANATLAKLKNSASGDLRQPVLLAIADLTTAITSDRVEQYNAQRRWADTAFRKRLPYETHRLLFPPDEGFATTKQRCLHSAIYLWTQYTLADRIDAPAWRTPPTESQLETYRTWLKDLGDDRQQRLLAWARSRPCIAA